MAEKHDRFADEIERLRRLRDELRVQMRLGRAEARERWEKLERDFAHLEAKLAQIREQSRGDLAEIREAAKLLADQIREGYRHLRARL
jgi:predicted  nucleic acid-binding Zn-ribbon protein